MHVKLDFNKEQVMVNGKEKYLWENIANNYKEYMLKSTEISTKIKKYFITKYYT